MIDPKLMAKIGDEVTFTPRFDPGCKLIGIVKAIDLQKIIVRVGHTDWIVPHSCLQTTEDNPAIDSSFKLESPDDSE